MRIVWNKKKGEIQRGKTQEKMQKKSAKGQEYKQNTWGKRINTQIIRNRIIKYED